MRWQLLLVFSSLLGEKTHQLSHSAVDVACVTTYHPGKMPSCCNSGTSVTELTSHFLIEIDTCSPQEGVYAWSCIEGVSHIQKVILQEKKNKS